MSHVVTRIAPSPTGMMHIGTVRTALYNYLYAKKLGGTFFIRIEDTDAARNRPEWTEQIWNDFERLGMHPDQKYITSERNARHVEQLKALIDSGKAYVSKEPKKDDPTIEVEVVRLRNPGHSLSFEDVVRGTLTFDTSEHGDFVIARSITDPLYHFAVVVDDGDANVTHVIRAEEHISNTPRQILILEALGYTRPVYAHIPLILAPDKSKLSKRKHAANLDIYLNDGYLVSALLNYLALIGWNPGGEQEIYTMDELTQLFTLEKVHKSGGVFDVVKLNWFNREHMLRMSIPEFWDYAKEYLTSETVSKIESLSKVSAVVPIMMDRASTFGELKRADEAGEYALFYTKPQFDHSLLKSKKGTQEDAVAHLKQCRTLLTGIKQEDWNATSVKEAVWAYAEEMGRGEVLWPLRVALSGREKSPDPFTIADILGRDETLARISACCD